MICPHCGGEAEDNAVFCNLCGKKITEEIQENTENTPIIENTEEAPAVEPTPVEPEPVYAMPVSMTPASEPDEKMPAAVAEKKKINPADVIALIAGTLLIVVGFVMMNGANANVYSASFGADFYTYIYQATCSAVWMLAKVVVALGWILVAIGILIDYLGLRGILSK